MNVRIKQIERFMERDNLDVVFITFPKHIYYLTGYYSEPHERFLGLIIPRGEEPFLLVPALDHESAEAESLVSRIYSYADTENAYSVLKQYLPPVRRMGVEKNHLTLKQYELLSSITEIQTVIDIEPRLIAMRALKTDDELIRIRHAVRLAEQVLQQGIMRIQAGMKESEIAAEIDYLMMKAGVTPAFQTTVLSGERSALPHGATGNRIVQQGDLLLFDMGVAADGYLSDLTRTFVIGDANEMQEHIYEAVLQANLEAIAAIKPNVPMAEIDRAARQCISSKGHGQYFTHRVGHGLGIEIHEYPSVHGENQDLLKAGMVITVEPGIYLPGFGGVRIEDDVLVTSKGAEVLSSFTKTLMVL
ncbi:Xaa-Pro peptidase family protein [Paenibacillus sp. R14(2021)]|uniref:M24 family metallopeptidase n=1 Tax=Paenibacillus sp. R14(2021) TaxID=2859228 RepID=UPI001C6162C3|nr:Xaa-Pro peptidase family protein [Paenibacillus sp. R14(2021)]